ncbi:unnamed protein product [Cuscuta epithymum]|uniref:Uncharacterized protein n=2 Tax=Cuscuta epithymum TaxID=186058 RepID=A0AAV0F370_9ASTE|nr:unnamed protein product [Cuscuta epithymum]
MAPDPRVVDAFNAMKSLGIHSSVVKPVLRKLLNLYGHKWELIQEDNYRTLADAIFEDAEDKPPDNENHSRTMDVVGPCKKLKCLDNGGTLDEDQVFSTMDNGSIHSNFEMFGSNPKNSLVDRGTDLVFVDESNQILPNTCLAPNISPVVSNTLDNSSTRQPKPARHHATECRTTINQVGSPSFDFRTNLHSISDIVSSSCGRVKLYLRCDSFSAQPNHFSPSINDVLKLVEDNYTTCKSDDFQLSIRKILKDVCEGYLELANNPIVRFLEEKSTNSCLSDRESLRVDQSKRQSMTKASSSNSSSSLSLVARPQPMSRGKKKDFKIYDITNGNEAVRISLLDRIGIGGSPNFFYIRENTVYQSAYVQFSLARIADDDCCGKCEGDCLSHSVPCACARETGGEFAYTSEGILREEFLRDCISMYQEPQKHYSFYCEDCPLERAKNTRRPEKCKGHLVRRFIKECWRKCCCDMSCGNRVVQRGITRRLQVFSTSDGKGWGVRTLEELPKGAFVCEYIGEILTNIELYERNQERGRNQRHTYPVLLDADWGSEGVLKDEDALCLDATYYGNVGRFINHRCFDSNLIEIPVQIETPDHHYYHIAFFTKRKVNALEELTWDYGIDFNDLDHPIKAFKCCCGSAGCRDRKGKGVVSKNTQFKEAASRS